MKACHKCGAPWEERHEPGRNEVCMRCGADMHCCLNCRLYDPMKARHCASSTTDPPVDKVGANVCDEFQMGDRQTAGAAAADRKKALDEKLKSLFKN